MNRIRLGEYNQLEVLRRADHGLYLDGGDEGDVLLPTKYVPEGAKVGDRLDVFIYLDSEERLVATTEKPLAKVGDFAFLEVAWVNKYGAFLRWGLTKDLFCPFREQKMRMQMGKSYIVHVHIDEESYRIVASAKVEHFFTEQPHAYQRGEAVDVLIWQKTDLGFKVIVDNAYPALVYDDQVFKSVHTGDRMRGYVSTVRPDGKIDISLQPIGRRQVLDFSEELLDYLQAHNGYCDLGDKSPAEDIKDRFQVSKKVFKQAVGDLYRQRAITIEADGLHLVNED